jgi:hypothetical protein
MRSEKPEYLGFAFSRPDYNRRPQNLTESAEKSARGLYAKTRNHRRWGFAPRPESTNCNDYSRGRVGCQAFFAAGRIMGFGWRYCRAEVLVPPGLLCTCGVVGVLLSTKLTAGTESSLFGAGAVFGLGTRLLFMAKQKRLRGGRLLFPLRRKK